MARIVHGAQSSLDNIEQRFVWPAPLNLTDSATHRGTSDPTFPPPRGLCLLARRDEPVPCAPANHPLSAPP